MAYFSAGGSGDGASQSSAIGNADAGPLYYTIEASELEEISMRAAFIDIGIFVIKGIAAFVATHYLLGQLQPGNDVDKGTTKKVRKILKGRRKKLRKFLKDSDSSEQLPVPTNEYEQAISGELIDPEEIGVGFSDIGGLEMQKKELRNLVIQPLRHPHLFSHSKLLRPPSGILLYGPPGTGKTMLAKAIAKESGAAFLNLRLSTLLNKWFGESQKLVRAVFSLAEKLSPTIVFIDEIDAFLRMRGSDDHSALSAMKAEFMSSWDGMANGNSSSARERNGFGVVVIGASNRIGDIDPAFMRRLARKFYVGYPNAQQRSHILRCTLKDDLDTLSGAVTLEQVAQLTEYYSGHDLNELCRLALSLPIQQLLRTTHDISNLDRTAVRKVTLQDFSAAQAMVFPEGDYTLIERKREAEAGTSDDDDEKPKKPRAAVNMAMMQALLRHLIEASTDDRPPFRVHSHM